MWFLSTYHKNKGIWWYLPSWNWSPNTSLGETLLDILGDGIDQVTWSDYRKKVDLHHNQHTRNYMASLLQEVRSLLEENLLNKWCIYSSKCWSHRVLHGMKHLIPPTAMASLHQLVGELPPKDFSGSAFVFFGSVKLTMESIDLYFFAFHKSRFNSFHPSVSYSYLLQTLPYFNHSDHSHCGCFLFLPSKPTCPMEVLLDQRTKMRHADYNIWFISPEP